MQEFRTAFLLLVLVFPGAAAALAQESASYRLNEHAVNAGGVPTQGQVHASSNFRLTLESIAGPIAHGHAQSKGFDAQGGLIPGLAPATEVTGLRFSGGDTLTWDGHPASGTFRLYRDALDAVSLTLGSCLEDGLAAPTADDIDDPAQGEGYAYLVTVANTLGEEGTPGQSSSGAQRTLLVPCP